MLVFFKGHWIDPAKVVKISAGTGVWTYLGNKPLYCYPTIWIALGGEDYIHFPTKSQYDSDPKLKEKEIDWNEICKDELQEIAQEINSHLKAAKCNR